MEEVTSLDVTITTTPVPSEGSNAGVIAGVICSLVVLVAVAIVVALVFWRRRKRKHQSGTYTLSDDTAEGLLGPSGVAYVRGRRPPQGYVKANANGVLDNYGDRERPPLEAIEEEESEPCLQETSKRKEVIRKEPMTKFEQIIKSLPLIDDEATPTSSSKINSSGRRSESGQLSEEGVHKADVHSPSNISSKVIQPDNDISPVVLRPRQSEVMRDALTESQLFSADGELPLHQATSAHSKDLTSDQNGDTDDDEDSFYLAEEVEPLPTSRQTHLTAIDNKLPNLDHLIQPWDSYGNVNNSKLPALLYRPPLIERPSSLVSSLDSFATALDYFPANSLQSLDDVSSISAQRETEEDFDNTRLAANNNDVIGDKNPPNGEIRPAQNGVGVILTIKNGIGKAEKSRLSSDQRTTQKEFVTESEMDISKNRDSMDGSAVSGLRRVRFTDSKKTPVQQ